MKNKLNIIVYIILSFLAIEKSHAEFRDGAECNNCSSTQYKNLAKSMSRTNDTGTVFIFDFNNHNLKKYYVENENAEGFQFTFAFEISVSNAELQLFEDLDSVVVASNFGDFGIDAPGSAYDYIGCSSCEANLGLWIINNHTWSAFWRESLAQFTETFDINAINFSFEYVIQVTFADGSTVTITMQNNQLSAVAGSYYDSDNNQIPRNSGDLEGSTYVFGGGSGGSNYGNFVDRTGSWGISTVGSGGGGGLSCTFVCDGAGSCTLTCKKL